MRQLILSILFSLTLAQTTYYISSSGSDANNGTSTSTPWQSWKNIYYLFTLSAGSQVLVKCGDTIPGAMYITANGTSGSPCVFGSYGTGVRPVMLGDFSKNVWIPVTGFSGYYKTAAPKGGIISSEQYQYSGGIWHALTVMGDISPDRTTWLNSMAAGSIGPTNNQNDTIFMRSYDGTAPTAATCCLAWDGMYLNNSKYTTIRDWDLKGFHSALYMYGDTNLTIRNCFIHDNDHLAVMIHHGRYWSVDSCKVDSCAYSSFYSYLSGDGRFSYDTVTNVQNIVKGRDWGTGRELNAFGHQGADAYAQGNYNVKVDHCYTNNIYDSAFDSYLCDTDTLTNNNFQANQGGMYLHGKNYYIANNTITIGTTTSTRKGVQVDGVGVGLSKILNNSFTNVVWGLAVNSLSSGATVSFSGNQITAYDASSDLDWFNVSSGITSTGNSFCNGIGKFYSNGTEYSSLLDFQSATGYESGSNTICTTLVATQIAINTGNNQSATVNTAVSIAPSVYVSDVSNNPVSGVSVTFAVASGGGSATGTSQTTNGSGIATVGSWTLGSVAGTNTLTVTSTGLTGSPITFTGTGTSSPPIVTGGRKYFGRIKR